MKNLKMFAIGLVAFAAMTIGVHAAANTDPAEVSFVNSNGVTQKYTSLSAAIAAANQESADHDDAVVTVKLDKNNLTEPAPSTPISSSSHDIVVTGNIVLDLGDYKITLNEATTRLVIKGGSLTIKGTEGKATIENTNTATASMIKVEGEDSHLTIEKGVTIDNKANSYSAGAVVLFGDTTSGSTKDSAKNSSIEISGTIKSAAGNAVSIRGEIKKVGDKVAPTVKINDGAVIDGEGGAAYYQAGYVIATIGKATITGPTAVSVKAGTLTLNNPTVTGEGDYNECNRTVGKTNLTGAAVQIEGNNGYDSPAKVTFNGGTYTSENGNAVKACAYEKSAVAEGSKINNGEFTSGDDEKGDPRPNIEFYFNESSTAIDYINDLEGFLVKGTFNNGPAVGDAKIGTNTNTSMTAPTLLAKLTNGANVTNGSNGSTLIGGGNSANQTPSEGQKPSDEQKPNTGDTANTPSDSKNPQTGDSIMTYMGLGIASIAVVGLGAKNLKKQTSR